MLHSESKIGDTHYGISFTFKNFFPTGDGSISDLLSKIQDAFPFGDYHLDFHDMEITSRTVREVKNAPSIIERVTFSNKGTGANLGSCEFFNPGFQTYEDSSTIYLIEHLYVEIDSWINHYHEYRSPPGKYPDIDSGVSFFNNMKFRIDNLLKTRGLVMRKQPMLTSSNRINPARAYSVENARTGIDVSEY